jgi:hypothetical protein
MIVPSVRNMKLKNSINNMKVLNAQPVPVPSSTNTKQRKKKQKKNNNPKKKTIKSVPKTIQVWYQQEDNFAPAVNKITSNENNLLLKPIVVAEEDKWLVEHLNQYRFPLKSPPPSSRSKSKLVQCFTRTTVLSFTGRVTPKVSPA